MGGRFWAAAVLWLEVIVSGGWVGSPLGWQRVRYPRGGGVCVQTGADAGSKSTPSPRVHSRGQSPMQCALISGAISFAAASKALGVKYRKWSI